MQDKSVVVGDPQKGKALVQNMPAVQVEMVTVRHVMAAQLPTEVNGLIIRFFLGEQKMDET